MENGWLPQTSHTDKQIITLALLKDISLFKLNVCVVALKTVNVTLLRFGISEKCADSSLPLHCKWWFKYSAYWHCSVLSNRQAEQNQDKSD